MEVTAHLDNLCPPFMNSITHQTNRKAMANWQQQRAVECDLFSLTLSDLPSFLSLFVYLCPYNYVLMMCCVLV